MIKKFFAKLMKLENRTDVIPLILRHTLVTTPDPDEDEEECDLHFGIVSMVAFLVGLNAARLAFGMIIIFLS